MAAVFALNRLGKVNPETERKTVRVLQFYFLKIFFLIFFYSLVVCYLCSFIVHLKKF